MSLLLLFGNQVLRYIRLQQLQSLWAVRRMTPLAGHDNRLQYLGTETKMELF